VPLAVEGDTATAILELTAGDEAVFILRYGPVLNLWSDEASSPRQLLDRTVEYWHDKAAGLEYEGEWRDVVVRSYLTLHLLTYVPTGAIVAAPTTSLPEWIGGGRNWDYRYTWLRDAAFTVEALIHLGHNDEAVSFFKWCQEMCGLEGDEPSDDDLITRLRILYRIDGSVDLEEEELTHLEGYKGSKPVRIGNGAFGQLQHDVYGELLASAHLLAVRGVPMGEGQWELIRILANLAAEEWSKPDSGIWEVRGGPFQFVHSNAMCWVALDRAVSLAEMMGKTGPETEGWLEVADTIKRDVLEHGWNEAKQAFAQHYDTDAMDASFLLLPLMGFLPIDDPRVVSTVERIQEELGSGPFVLRYRTDETDDGVFGSEGAFTLCSFWLVQVLVRMGRRDEARHIFQELLGYANHLGLFAEMVDPRSGVSLGNFPQAFTHIGLILAALEFSNVEADPVEPAASVS
jgi:GH15 family glucan-1,4-alpha-glucosidase